ncbi:unnamed protein product, partial [Musa acuminata subsp. burmannicoides]
QNWLRGIQWLVLFTFRLPFFCSYCYFSFYKLQKVGTTKCEEVEANATQLANDKKIC